MNWNDAAAEITRREGLKKQVSIAQVKEVIGILADWFHAAPGPVIDGLASLGLRRAKARAATRKLKHRRPV